MAVASSAPRVSRRQILAGAATVVAIPGSPGFVARTAAANAEPIAPLIDALVRQGRSDGISAAIIHRGATRFHNAGIVSRTIRTLADERSVYEIGSITKTFTGLLLAHAIGEGRVRADDPVQRHLPPGFGNLARGGRAVTLIDLADTTSALPDNLPDRPDLYAGTDPKRLPFVAADVVAGYSQAALLADLRAAALIDLPGRLPRHSNVAAQLLGIVLERIYGTSYATLVRKRIEEPLRMRPGIGVVSPRHLATGYDADGTAMPPMTAPVLQAAAGLRYSTADMARYLAAHLVPRDAALALVQAPAWGSADEGACGLPWTITKTADSQPYIRYSGSTFGFSSYCDFYPAQGYAVALLANRPGLQDALQEVADAAYRETFGYPNGLAALETALAQTRFADVAATVAAIRRRFPDLHLSEERVNLWGYRLLADDIGAAAALFGYNAALHPDSWNAHDSLAEAEAKRGDTASAITHYRRSLELNPSNANAEDMLAKFQKNGR